MFLPLYYSCPMPPYPAPTVERATSDPRWYHPATWTSLQKAPHDCPDRAYGHPAWTGAPRSGGVGRSIASGVPPSRVSSLPGDGGRRVARLRARRPALAASSGRRAGVLTP